MRAAWMLSTFAVALAPATASAYTLRATPGGATLHWERPTVAVRVDPALCAAPDRGLALARESALAWTEAPGEPPILEIEGATTGGLGYRGDGHDENGIYVLESWPYGPALAVTLLTVTEDEGIIVDADVAVSERADLAIPAGEDEAIFDLEGVLTHELGHVLGLGESEVAGATMFPALAAGDLGQRTIEDDDAAGIEALYPRATRTEEDADEGAADAAGDGGATTGARTGLPSRRLATYGCAAGGRASHVVSIVLALAVVAATRRARLRRRIRALALAATALVLLSAFAPSPPRRVGAEVIDTHVEDRDGLYVTVARVITDDGDEGTLEMPGGARNGLVQIVGGFEPPRSGDRIVVTAPAP